MDDHTISVFEFSKRRRDVLSRIVGHADFIETVVANIINGSDLITLAKTWGLSHADLYLAIERNEDWMERYQTALKVRNELKKIETLREVERIASVCLKDLCHEDGRAKPMSEWPDAIAAAVSSIEIVEYFEGTGKEKEQVGWIKKFKLWDKDKQLGNLLKMYGQLTEKVEVTASDDLASLITQTRKYLSENNQPAMSALPTQAGSPVGEGCEED